MASEEVTELGQQVRDLAEKLQKVEQICKEYNERLGVESGTPEECQDFKQLTEYLTKIRDDLKNVQEKEASKEIFIEFVGATSSGKSSLINALLGERRLPVGCVQTTMCLFKVRTKTEESDDWSVEIDGKPLQNGKGEKAVNDLLSQMSGKKQEDERKDLGISTNSVVQVNWPIKCKKLPPNVVLIDTPGLGEGKERGKVVTESCKKADIIVAVMDTMSPSKETVTELVNEVNCQFTFGVFTKLDVVEKAKNDNVDVKFLRKEYEKEYLESVRGKGEVYFVSVGCVESLHEEDGHNGFRRFEESLAGSATKLKDESLIKQAQSVVSDSKEVFTKFQDILETRKIARLKSLRVKEALFDGDCNAITEICRNIRSSEEIDDIFTEVAIEPLLKKFEDDVMSGRTEKEALAEFHEIVNDKIKKIVASKSTKARADFNQWESGINHSYPIRLNWTLEDDKIPHLEYKELPTAYYNCLKDPHAWMTNNYLWGSLITGGAIAVTGASGVGIALGAGLLALEAASVLAVTVGGAAGAVGIVGGAPLTYYVKEVFNIGIGDCIKQKIPFSRKKLAAWRRFLVDELKNLHQWCINAISKETDRIINEAKGAKDQTSKEIVKEMNMKPSPNLTKLATDVKKSGNGLEEINATFDTMLSKLQRKESDLDCDQTKGLGLPGDVFINY